MQSVKDTEYRRYRTGLVVLSGVIIGTGIFPDGVSFNELSSRGLAGTLTGLFILVLLVERATEIAMIIWREADTEILKKKISAIPEADRTGTRAIEYQAALKELEDRAADTKRWALSCGIVLSVIVCVAGAGLLTSVLNYSDGNRFQKYLLRAVDIVLTSGLIAGGSDSFHQFVATLDTFFKNSRDRLNQNS